MSKGKVVHIFTFANDPQHVSFLGYQIKAKIAAHVGEAVNNNVFSDCITLELLFTGEVKLF